MKKDSLEKKIAAYVTLAAAYLAAHPVDADAQIMYTDVNPDLVIHNSYFNLDLNNDGVVDFKLRENNNHDAYNTCLNSNKAMPLLNSYGVTYSPFLSALASGDTIDGNQIFINGNVLHMATAYSYVNSTSSTWWVSSYVGAFLGNNLYMGLKVISGGLTYYGWTRLDVSYDEIVLKDYALNLTPDSAILAGQGYSCSLSSFMTPIGLTPICNSVNLNLVNSAGLTITWIKDSVNISGAISSQLTINQGGAYNALVSDSSLCNVLTGPVVAYRIPAVNTGADSAPCSNDPSQIYLSASLGQAPYQYLWSNGNTTQNLTDIYGSAYSVTVTDNNGCMNTDTVTVVHLFSPPLITETHVDSVCNPNGSIDITVTGDAPPFGYSWNNGMGTQDLLNLSTGEYILIVSDTNGCESAIAVSIFNFGIPVVTELNNTLYSSFSGKNQWYYSSTANPLIGDTLSYYTPTSIGIFYAEAIYSDTCSFMSAPFLFWYDGVKFISSSEISYTILNKKLLLHLPDNSLLSNQLEIINELGQLVSTVSVTNQTPEADLSALPSGIYFFHIRSKQKTLSGKFFIE